MLPGIAPANFCTALSYLFGDSWSGINPITVRLLDGSVLPAAVASCVLIFKDQDSSPNIIQELSSTLGTITITSPANWEFSIPAVMLTLPVGDYVWAFRTTDINGIVQTYFKGTIEVKSGF